MLLMPNKKKLATLIVSGMKPDFVQKMGEKREDKPIDMSKAEGGSEEESLGLISSAEKIMSAIKEGKATQLVSALKEFYSMCEEAEDATKEEY